jgi:hypothetical protein
MPIALRAVAFYTRHESIVPDDVLRWVGPKGSRWGLVQRRAYSRSVHATVIGLDATHNAQTTARLRARSWPRSGVHWSWLQ